MFLSVLNQKENENFLELAKLAMLVDGVITEEEKTVLDNFKRETGLMDYEFKNLEYRELQMYFDTRTKTVKKAVLFEISGMLYADGEVSDDEHTWILNLGTSWGFRENEIKKIIRWVIDFNDMLTEGFEYILKKERL